MAAAGGEGASGAEEAVLDESLEFAIDKEAAGGGPLTLSCL